MPLPLIFNHTLAFGLEIALLIFIGMFGFSLVAGPWLNWGAALVLVAIAMGLWAYFAAPKSTTRLDMPVLLIFKIAMFGAGTLALLALNRPVWALVLGGLAALHLIMATALSSV